MTGYRVDIKRDGDWEPGGVTFHQGYQDILKSTAAEISHDLKVAARVVLVDLLTGKVLEVIAQFEQPVEEVA